jgi:hypothetical protein
MSRRFGAIPTDEVCYGHASIYIHPSASMVWDPVGDAASPTGNIFTALINGVPAATTVPYDTDVNEKGMSANMVLHNTTKGKKVRIVSADLATNIITVEANSPDDASAWANNDSLTTASQTNTGRTGGFSDFDVTAFLTYTNSVAMFFQATLVQQSGTVGATMIGHPYQAYAQAQETFNLKAQVLLIYAASSLGLVPIVWENGRAYFTLGIFWPGTGYMNGIMSFIGEC